MKSSSASLSAFITRPASNTNNYGSVMGSWGQLLSSSIPNYMTALGTSYAGTSFATNTNWQPPHIRIWPKFQQTSYAPDVTYHNHHSAESCLLPHITEDGALEIASDSAEIAFASRVFVVIRGRATAREHSHFFFRLYRIVNNSWQRVPWKQHQDVKNLVVLGDLS